MCVCPTYVGVSTEARRGHWIHDSRELWQQVVSHYRGRWELKPGPLEGKQTFCMAEPSLQFSVIYGSLPKEFDPGERAKEDHGQTEKFKCM